MQRSEFVIVYMPFEDSDMTLEQLEFGKDEADALKEFEKTHPVARVKEVKAK
jgi:hypothetical protein